MRVSSIDLNINSFQATLHNVKPYADQKIIYSQNWVINFSNSNNEFKSPVFCEKNNHLFNIFFVLSFDANGNASLSGYMVEETIFKSFRVFFKIGDPQNENRTINDEWSFKINKNCNTTSIPNLKKSDLTIENGWLNKDQSLNVYFEISYCDASAKTQQIPTQQKFSQKETEKKMQQTPGRIGLKNMNSMCYINSFLQVLFHIPEFREILFSVDTSKTDSKPILTQTQFLFYMMENSNTPCSAVDLSKEISFCSNKNNCGQQQDALEFAMHYLDDLEKELQDTGQENAIKNLFYGSYKTIIKCQSVDYESSNSETFNFINIPVNSQKKNESQNLNKSIKQYIMKSQISYKTDQFGTQIADRWVQFVNLPPVLQICFLRSTFDQKTSQLEKQTIPIEFDSTLYMYYTTKKSDDVYRLYAVLSHNGGGDCGHYCVFIRDLPGKRWFKYNDSTVNEVTKQASIVGNYGENLRKNPEIAYILYYVRKNDIKRLFESTKSNEMASEMITYMRNLQLKKSQEEYEKNNVHFQFILEKDVNSKSSINDFKTTINDKKLKIQNSESTLTLYIKVAELFNKKVTEIRLWLIDPKLNNLIFISPRKDMNLNNLMTNCIFIQDKPQTELIFPVIKINNNKEIVEHKIMIFLKYFDTRLKLPIRYIGPVMVNENSFLDVPQINSKLGFSEWTKFYFFKEKGPTAAQIISPEKTFKSAQIKQGSFLIVQVDLNKTALAKKMASLKNGDQVSTEKVEDLLPDLKGNPNFSSVEFSDQNDNVEPLNLATNRSKDKSDTPMQHFNASEVIEGLRTDLLDYYLASRFNQVHFNVYDYEKQRQPKFTVDFPASLKYKDMCHLIMKVENKEEADGFVLLFNKDQRRDKAAYDFITECRFETQLQQDNFPENRLYYLYVKGVQSMSGKFIYNIEIAPDGYNVSFRKTVIEKKQITPIELIKNALNQDELASLDVDHPDNLRCFTVCDSVIDSSLDLNEQIFSSLHPIRVCKLGKPNSGEFAVRVYHAKIDKQLGLSFFNEPFYIYLKDGVSVDQFKACVLNANLAFINKLDFEKARIELMKVDNHRSSGIFLNNADDKIVGLKNESVIYVIYK